MELIIVQIICGVMIGRSLSFPIPDNSNDIKLLNFESTATSNERRFSYNLDDGQSRSEIISIMNVDDSDGKEIIVHGSYSFNGVDGKIYLVEYTADKNGYHPKVMIVEAEPMDKNIVEISAFGVVTDAVSSQVVKSLVG